MELVTKNFSFDCQMLSKTNKCYRIRYKGIKLLYRNTNIIINVTINHYRIIIYCLTERSFVKLGLSCFRASTLADVRSLFTCNSEFWTILSKIHSHLFVISNNSNAPDQLFIASIWSVCMCVSSKCSQLDDELLCNISFNNFLTSSAN